MLTRRSFLAAGCAAAAAQHRGDPRPNIVVILADDLGYGDVRCYNAESRIPTPHIDRLAAAGMRFTDAHTPSAVCSPTRYGLLTGRFAWRTRLTRGVLDSFDPPLIESGRMTVASLLKQQGYATACVGKWHLGMQWTRRDGSPVEQRTIDGFRPGDDVDYTQPLRGGPIAAGFDYYFGIAGSLNMSPFCFIENDRTVGLPNIPSREERSLLMSRDNGVKVPGFELKHVMPACIEKATGFIARNAGGPKPFFLYLPLSAPHLPVVPNDEFKGRSKAGAYGDFVVEVDAAVGAVMAALDKAGVAKNTLLLFTSDNGGIWHWWDFVEKDDRAHGKPTPRSRDARNYGHAGNGPWRGTKADIWEGGHRVPFVVRWPDRVKPGSVSNQLVCLIDLLATVGDMLRVKLPKGAGEDSVSILPVLLDSRTREPVRDHLVLHSLRGAFAVRQGDWKMIPSRGSGGFSSPVTVEPQPGEPVGQLYNLRRDPAETRNLYNDRPDIVRRLAQLLERVRNK